MSRRNPAGSYRQRPYTEPAHDSFLRRRHVESTASLKRIVPSFLLFFALFYPFGATASGQVSLTTLGSAYAQNFNTLATTGTSNAWTDNSTIAGWYSNLTVYIADVGTSTTGGIHSHGSASSADRALGGVSSGSASPMFAVRLVNNTGATVTSLDVAYTAEQWRQTVNSQTLTFDYQVGATSITTGTWTSVSALNFTALLTGLAGPLDGNASGNFAIKSSTISVSVANGQEIWLRWSKTGTTSPGLAIDDFSVTPNGPNITQTGSLTDFGSVNVGNTSSQQSFSVAGNNLQDDIVATAPTDFEVSTTSGSGFGSSVTLTQASGSVSTTTIYARFSPLSTGAKSGTISCASSGTVTKNVAVSGTGVSITPTVILTGTLSDFGTVVVGNTTAEQSYTVAGLNLTDDIAITAPPDFEISTTSGSGFGPSLALTQSGGTVSLTTIYLRFAPSSSGAKSGDITHTSTGAMTKNQAVSGTGTNAPTITVSVSSLPSLGLVVSGSQSSEQSYTVSGANLTDGILATAPTGFEVSTTSGSGFSTSVTLTQVSGSVSITTIYARFAPGSADGAYSGNISHSSSGATTKNVGVSGTAIAAEPATQSAISFGAVGGTTAVVNFSGGNGARRIVVARSGSAVSFTPTDAVAASGVNSNFVTAADQGSGNKIVFDGTGTTVTVTGLSGTTTYHFASYEYNIETGTSQNYLTTAPGTGNTTTAMTVFTYRSFQTGNWNAASTWESTEDGTNWSVIAGTPTSANGAISIRNGHTVTVTAAVSADEVVIENGGNLTVNSGVTLTVNNGAGDDIVVQNGGLLVVGSGTAATIPSFSGGASANINTGGTLKVAGSGITGSGAGVNLSNFTYQDASILEYSLSTPFSASGVTYFPNVNTTTIPVFRVTQSLSGVGGANPTAVNGVIEVTGSISWQSAGTKTFRNGIRGFGTMTQGAAGQFIINGSTSELGGGTLTLGTNGLSIASANTTLSSSKQIDGGPVSVTGTLSCSTNIISGTASFTLFSGATLAIGSSAGITSSGATGNIQVSGTRTYDTGANYIYNGSSAQETGDGFPASVNNFTINNSTGVTPNNSVTVNGTLTLSSGALVIAGHTLTINGIISTTGGSLTGGATSNMIISGLGAGATVPAVTLDNLTLNRLNGATLGGATDINGSLTLANGVLSGGGNLTFETGAAVTRSGGSLSGTPVFIGPIDVTYSAGLTTGTELPGSATDLHALTINADLATVSLNSDVTVNGDLTLTAGTLSVSGTHILTIMGQANGAGTLTSSATGTVSYAQTSDGQDVLAANYGSLMLSNFNKDFPSGRTIRISGTFSAGSATAHSVSGSTFNFNGSGAQTIPGFNGASGYYNLTASNGSAKTAGANLWIQALLTISASTILADGGHTIYVAGNINNNGQHTGAGKVTLGIASHLLSGAGSYTNLELNDVGATLSGADLSVNGTLTLTSGKITTGSHAVIIGPSGSISGANSTSFVVGTLKKSFPAGVQSFTFAIGDSVYYSPVEIASLTVTAPGTLTGTTTPSAHPNMNTSGFLVAKRVNRYWSFAAEGGLAFTNFSVTFNFVSADVDPGANSNNFYVKRFNGTNWSLATIGNRTTTSTQATGIAGFSDFAVGEIAVGIPVNLLLTSGNNQSASVASALTNPFVVTVTDGLSNPVQNAPITFAVSATPIGGTGQSLTITNTTTALNGQASTVLTMGTKAGQYSVTASCGILPFVTFNATATGGAAATLAVESGAGQEAPIFTLLSPFVVKVRDVGGNLVPGATINFVLQSVPFNQTGAELSQNSSLSDAIGQVSTRLALGSKLGQYSVMATASNNTSINLLFTATATAGLPTQLVKVSGDNQVGPVNSSLQFSFVVQVADAGGNPLPGIPVSFTVFSSPSGAIGHHMTPTATSTNAQGQASTFLTLGNLGGQYRASATSSMLGGAFITWTANATAPTAVEYLEGTPADFGLWPAYPNPFNPSTRIRFSLPEESKVKLLVYNVLGIRVDELLGETLSAGMYNVVWNADLFPSGSYIVRFQALSTKSSEQFTSTTRVMLLK